MKPKSICKSLTKSKDNEFWCCPLADLLPVQKAALWRDPVAQVSCVSKAAKAPACSAPPAWAVPRPRLHEILGAELAWDTAWPVPAKAGGTVGAGTGGAGVSKEGRQRASPACCPWDVHPPPAFPAPAGPAGSSAVPFARVLLGCWLG